MRRRVERGEYNGGPPPYGYVWDGPKGERHLVIFEREAVIVRRIFGEYVAGRSQKQIARDLTHEGVPAQRGGAWHQGTIARYLANPIYAGRVRINGEAHEGKHEAIISAELWDQARGLREAGARSPGKGRGRRPKGRHLFINGHLRCGLCGGAMIPRTFEDYERRPTYAVYACYTRIRLGPDACEQRPIKREAVDRAVMEYFAARVLDAEATHDEFKRAAESKLAEIRELRLGAEGDERKAVDALRRVKRDYLDGRLSIEDWQEFRGELESEHEAARAKLTRFEEQERRVTADANLEAGSETLHQLSELRAAVIRTMRQADGPEAVRAALTRVRALHGASHGLGRAGPRRVRDEPYGLRSRCRVRADPEGARGRHRRAWPCRRDRESTPNPAVHRGKQRLNRLAHVIVTAALKATQTVELVRTPA
jgi:hypothetical protein